MRFRRPVAPLGDGNFRFEFDIELKEAIVAWAVELSGELGSDSDALRRLFPTAYPDDPERDAGYQALAKDDLIDRRREAIATMTETVNSDVLTFEQLSAWMGICNDLRLVLGTQLEVSEDDLEILPDDDPRAAAMNIYRILGWVVSDIVDALSAAL